MAGNTRGKIKEHLEGCHRNMDWQLVHLEKVVALIKDHNPKLTETIVTLAQATKTLDESIQAVYGMI